MRILICAMEAPLAPLNGLRLQIRELARHLAAHHEVCVIAYRWPDQEGPPPDGVELIALRPCAPAATGPRRSRGWSRSTPSGCPDRCAGRSARFARGGRSTSRT